MKILKIEFLYVFRVFLAPIHLLSSTEIFLPSTSLQAHPLQSVLLEIKEKGIQSAFTWTVFFQL